MSYSANGSGSGNEGMKVAKTIAIIIGIIASLTTIGGQLVVYGEMRATQATTQQAVRDISVSVDRIATTVNNHEVRLSVIERTPPVLQQGKANR